MLLNKKGIEMAWWTLLVLVIGIVIFLIFFYFIRSGILQIGGITNSLFGTPEHFAANTT